MNFIAVFIGGGLGALLRYILSIFYSKEFAILPFHTLLGNFIGCLLAGIAFGIFLVKAELNPILKTLIITGFCGGLTTFSTFSLETVNYLQTGEYLKAILYILISLLICIISVILGMILVKKYV